MKQRAVRSGVLIASWQGAGSATDSKYSIGDSGGELVVWDWRSSDANAANLVAKAKADFATKPPKTTVEFVAQPFDQYYSLLGARSSCRSRSLS